MVIEVVPGVSWYDLFEDMSVGQGVPIGWQMIGAAAIEPTCVADLTAFGGKRLDFNHLLYPSDGYGMGMVVAGTPVSWEVLMRLRVNQDVDASSPISQWGGPGGRFSVGADRFMGVGASMGNRESTTECNFYCLLGRGHYLWEPPFSRNYRNIAYIKARDGTGATTEAFGAYGSGAELGWAASGPTALQSQSGVDEPGVLVANWSYARLKYDGVNGIARLKWWPDYSGEPNVYREEAVIQNLNLPDVVGMVGGLFLGESRDSDQRTKVDFISVSIDPNVEAFNPALPTIDSECPIPPATIDEAYSYTLTATVPV